MDEGPDYYILLGVYIVMTIIMLPLLILGWICSILWEAAGVIFS